MTISIQKIIEAFSLSTPPTVTNFTQDCLKNLDIIENNSIQTVLLQQNLTGSEPTLCGFCIEILEHWEDKDSFIEH